MFTRLIQGARRVAAHPPRRLSGAPRRAGAISAAVVPPRRHFLVAAGALLIAGTHRVRASTPLEQFTDGHAGGRTLSHRTFDELLARYVRSTPDGINRVDYTTWSASSADRRALAGYIEQVSAAVPATLERAEQFAFWANLYNAATLRVVLDAYPVRSIRAIRPHWLAIGPWDETVVRVQGIDLSLNDIEHRILRPRWHDPRVHYAVNCASLGCPNLGVQPYKGETLEADLTAAAHRYVSHPRGARIVDQKLIVSSIYRWYGADFGGSDAAIIEHLRNYAAPELGARLREFTQITDHEYDWTLNDLTRSFRAL